ncbi:MAG: hypothetical protein LQ343_000544 [Gyalolechia ehrenbergii]|nr:MAG: hypothetical protein LQ343_000544 [Gyalolechia ehrenbergii]
MTHALLKPPTTLQPRPKANPTFSSASLDTQTPFRTPQQSRPSSENSQSSSRKPSPVENTSARATTALIRRVLCPQPTTGSNEAQPIEDLLPPLTSSNDVDLQLYAIIAIVVKETIYSWYGKITSDQTFVEEVVRIIAHCTTGLEGRLRKVDIESLTFDEIPELVENHISAYRISHDAARTPGIIVNPRAVYHALNPHPALSPVPDPSFGTSATQQSRNEADYRQLLVQGALAILLPTEDLENTCLRTLVADVIAETILGRSIGGRVCEGWFVWTRITKLVIAVQAQLNPRTTGEEIEVDTRSRLEKFGLLSERGDDTRPATDGRRSAFSEVFWRFLQTNLFPHNALPPPSPDPPTAEQQMEIRRRCAEALSALFPDILHRAAGLSREDVVKEVESDLDVWGDAYMNKHLSYQILDLVIVRVLPEMGEKGVKELMEARGIGI